MVPTVRHGLVVVNEPGPETIVKVIGVPAGALLEPVPEPSLTFMCAVKTWVVFTGFSAVGGLIWMFASTYVLTASAELRPVPSVWTVNVVGGEPIDSVADAWPVTFPPVAELKVIVHWPSASVFAPAWCSVPVGVVCTAPFGRSA